MTPTTPGQILDHAARTWGDTPAIRDGGRTISWVELERLSREAAGAWRSLGVAAGDRVVIRAENRWEWVVAALGAQRLGAAIVPLNTRYVAAEVEALVRRSRAVAVATTGGLLGVDLAGQVAGLGLPILRLDQPDWLGEAVDGDAAPDDVADLLFTSGTTGLPKAVPMTHAQNARTFRTWAEVVGLVPGDRYLVVAPFFHAFGYKAGWLACLLAGAVIVPMAYFDATAVRERSLSEQITVLPGPPAIYQTLLQQGGLAGGALRLAVTGAASVPVDLIRRMREELGFRDVLTAYGLTECCGVATMCRRDDDAETVSTRCGRAIPGVEVAVVDAAGAPVPVGEPGEVAVRGYNVLTAYDGGEPAPIEDGWLRTGDVGVLDARGYLRIVDRLKDLVNVGGFKVAPVEVEEVIRGAPGVVDVAVVGMAEPRLGEVTVAFVVGTVDPDALITFCRERMANFKVPRRFIAVDALPRNAGGKVMKGELRARLVG